MNSCDKTKGTFSNDCLRYGCALAVCLLVFLNGYPYGIGSIERNCREAYDYMRVEPSDILGILCPFAVEGSSSSAARSRRNSNLSLQITETLPTEGQALSLRVPRPETEPPLVRTYSECVHFTPLFPFPDTLCNCLDWGFSFLSALFLCRALVGFCKNDVAAIKNLTIAASLFCLPVLWLFCLPIIWEAIVSRQRKSSVHKDKAATP